MGSMLRPRFAWLGFLLGFAALHRLHRNRPAAPEGSVFIAFPIVTPMLGGLTASALGSVLIALSTVFDVWPPTVL
jgi:hypothetical protein